MTGGKVGGSAPGAVAILDEAVGLLRRARADAFAAWVLGALPFAVTFVYFWAEMSRSSLALRHCAPLAAALGLLYVWMKCWHAVAAGRLKAALTGGEPPDWTAARIRRMLLHQAVFQPASLWVLPLAALAAVPFGWTYAFFRNVTIMGDGREERPLDLARRAWGEARRWPMQNHLLIAVVWLVSLVVWLNVAATILILPWLLRTLLGIETEWTMGGVGALNTTFLAAGGCITYVLVGPLSLSAYILRCHYGESRRTGEDLKIALAGARNEAARALWAALLVAGLLAVSVPAGAAVHGAAGRGPELERAVQGVLARPEFAWKLPREAPPPEEKEDLNPLAKLAFDAGVAIQRWLAPVYRQVGRFFEWLGSLVPGRRADPKVHTPGTGWIPLMQWITFIVLLAGAGLIGVIIYRARKARKVRAVSVTPVPAVPEPEPDDASLAAAQRASDEWLSRARDMLRCGEWRDAIRAGYLGCLAVLSESRWITLAAHKSNHEYLLELQRRASSLPAIPHGFSVCSATFERVWYGLYPTDADAVEALLAEVIRLRSHAPAN